MAVSWGAAAMSVQPGITSILIIRHAEKPDDEGDPHLSAAGRARARMLAEELPSLYPTLHRLFATAPSKASNRPYETIVPLAAATGLKIDSSFTDKQHAELSEHILKHLNEYAGKTVLICWHHETIPAIARGGFGQQSAPARWPKQIFDQIWQIDYVAPSQSSFTIKAEPAVTTS
jgi:hypothetical protein